jgi:PAS domain S-box-containing protein
MMNWAVVGLLYAGVYAALMTALADQPSTRLIIGNAALMLPPLAPLAVLARRRRAWRGRQSVFWWAIGAWAALWLFGQFAWASDELWRAAPASWFRWPIILQLCASALPLIALVAWPHRGVVAETAMTVAIDIAALVFLTGFLYWSLIIAPGIDPAHHQMALQSLATIGPLVRLAAAAGLLTASLSAGRSAWAMVYRRMAYGMAAAFAVLIWMSLSAVRGDYQTGSPFDIGWMLPFFFAAWAASMSPASPMEWRVSPTRPLPQTSPMLLFVALLIVPVVGYGLRFLMPLGEPVDSLREIATACTIIGGMALVLIRLRLDQRLGELANQRLRLLATACEQAGELIIIIGRDSRVEYANDAFCRAMGYTHDELESIAPDALVAEESMAAIPKFNQSLKARNVTRMSLSLARKDGVTFQAACVATPIVNAAGRITHFVAVIRDTTEELRLREQLVRGERLSALGEFVSGVALEINNPLQSVIGSLELVLDQQIAPALRGDVERARFEAGRAGRIVRNLLRFVRQAPNQRLLMDLNEIVKATMGVRAYELELAGIQIREDYAPLLPLVLANREEIQQVILNLIMNAQQAMSTPDGKRVLSVRTCMVGGDAVLEVRDTGPGIPTELAGRIFEPFFTTRSAGAGPGLGLSLSLGIANAHQGQLEAVAAPSGGCFRLTLPGSGFPGPAAVH